MEKIDLREVEDELRLFYLYGYKDAQELKRKVEKGLMAAIEETHKVASEYLDEYVKEIEQHVPNATPIKQLVEEVKARLMGAKSAAEVHQIIGVNFPERLEEILRGLVDEDTFNQLHTKFIFYPNFRKFLHKVWGLYFYTFRGLSLEGFTIESAINLLLAKILDGRADEVPPDIKKFTNWHPDFAAPETVQGLERVREAFIREVGDLGKVSSSRIGEIRAPAGEIKSEAARFTWTDPKTGETYTPQDLAIQSKPSLFRWFGHSFTKSIHIKFPVQVELNNWVYEQVVDGLNAEFNENIKGLEQALANQMFYTKWDIIGARLWELMREQGEPAPATRKEAQRVYSGNFVGLAERNAHLFRHILWETAHRFIINKVWHKEMKVGKRQVIELVSSALKEWIATIVRPYQIPEDIVAKMQGIVDDQTIKNNYINAFASRVIQKYGEWSPENTERIVPLTLLLSIRLEDFLALGHYPFDNSSCYGGSVWASKINQFLFYPERAVCLIYYNSITQGDILIGRALVDIKKRSVSIEDEHLFLDDNWAKMLFGGYNSDIKKSLAFRLSVILSKEVRK